MKWRAILLNEPFWVSRAELATLTSREMYEEHILPAERQRKEWERVRAEGGSGGGSSGGKAWEPQSEADVMLALAMLGLSPGANNGGSRVGGGEVSRPDENRPGEGGGGRF